LFAGRSSQRTETLLFGLRHSYLRELNFGNFGVDSLARILNLFRPQRLGPAGTSTTPPEQNGLNRRPSAPYSSPPSPVCEVTMAEVKVSRSQWIPQPLLGPYRHELNSAGTACARDCPACRWNKRTNDAPWNRRKTASKRWLLPPHSFPRNRDSTLSVRVRPRERFGS